MAFIYIYIYIYIYKYITYLKMAKDTSANYYQNDKKYYKKKLVRDIEVFLKKKKKIMTI